LEPADHQARAQRRTLQGRQRHGHDAATAAANATADTPHAARPGR